MHLVKRYMNLDYAVEILKWKYEEPYELYNDVLNSEAIDEMLEKRYFIIVEQNNEIIGYFCTGESAQVPAGDKVDAYEETCIDIGIGMKPNLTGKGFGSTFFSFILQDIQKTHPKISMRLTVATFNERAIHLYEKFGFEKQKKFDSDAAEFITMKRGISL